MQDALNSKLSWGMKNEEKALFPMIKGGSEFSIAIGQPALTQTLAAKRIFLHARSSKLVKFSW